MSIHPVEATSDTELVATVLGMQASDEAVVGLAVAVTTEGRLDVHGIREVARKYSAVGPRRIARLEAAIELGRRALTRSGFSASDTVSTPEEVAELFMPLAAGKQREHFWVLCLDTKNHVRTVAEVSIGSLNASIVHPRELFRYAIAAAAASVVVVHNHPSGDTTPSGADIQLTRRLVKAGDVIGIEVLDHVIVGSGEHSSLREMGLM